MTTPGRTTRVHLIRHGEVENPEGTIYGRLPGFVLSAAGREQARLTAAQLGRLTAAPIGIASSPLERARETAAILHDELSAQKRAIAGSLSVDERLVEAGSWTEGLPRRFAPRAFLGRLLDPAARAKRESLAAIALRMRGAVRDLLAASPDVTDHALVSHQLPIWVARLAFEQGFPQSAPLHVRTVPWLFFRERCSYASITTLELRQGERLDGELAGIRYWAPDASPGDPK